MEPTSLPVIRIEYFIDHLKVGGAQRHLVELFSGLDRQRFALQVCVAKGGGALVPLIERMGIPVRSFGVAASLAQPATLAGLVATARRLRAERVHVVHGYLYEGNILGVLAGRLAGTPVRLASKRSLDRYPRRSQRTATRLANRWAHRIVCNADAVSRFVLEEERPAPAKVVVIPNGIRFAAAPTAGERPAGVPSGVKLVGAVGRLNWKKAYHHLLDAAARVRAVRDDVQFVVVGDGPMRGEVEAEATRLGIRPYVHLLGEIRDARSLMRSFDVFVISSVIEGMPNVLLEALAAERAVVVTGVGGIPEIVTHEKSGLVVPPGDPGALAAGVLRLLANPAESAAFGAAGRRTVESHFSVPAMVESFTRLYEECLAAAGVAFASRAPASLASGRL